MRLITPYLSTEELGQIVLKVPIASQDDVYHQEYREDGSVAFCVDKEDTPRILAELEEKKVPYVTLDEGYIVCPFRMSPSGEIETIAPWAHPKGKWKEMPQFKPQMLHTKKTVGELSKWKPLTG